jgi:hypothetical protein
MCRQSWLHTTGCPSGFQPYWILGEVHLLLYVRACLASNDPRRITNPAGRERELARLSSCSRCPAVTTNSGLGLLRAKGTYIVHEMPISPAIFLPLIYGQYTKKVLIFLVIKPLSLIRALRIQ